ncbi:PE-PPE domain-containing protein [Mycobacterium sp. CPCC 205372]|uniref:PE-PPE domain-containing protein n=1 Tax=Mycobacterium hippophais TaxID=3016340 RepID=A0ABT4PRU3_9MYCO|nr:PE-PPE domain-containing protein [Mycobacterium hippophais]MCZ8379209.1 PE-PPE domain-containing protein [Mycobacterium hippophais]
MKLAPVVTTGLALPVAGALAAVCATNPTIAEVGLAAASTTIFVDGTVSPFLTDRDDPPGSNPLGSNTGRMTKSFDGRYDNFPNNKFVDYPGSLGIVSILSHGLGAPTFDESEQEAVDKLKTEILADESTETLYVVGYSQGASAVVRAVKDLEADEESGYTPGNVVVILAANPRRNDGGLLTRFPAFTLPLVGATFGEGTTSGETKIIQVTKQYDGVADAPVYFLNPVADANAILGYVYLHSGYYQDVTIDPDNPPADAVVSTDGNVTDILLPNAVGQLPLTQPLRSLGVPDDVIAALDPLLRAVIETAYDRTPDGDTAPSEPVRFKLLPGPDQWAGDAQSVAAGAVQTVQALGALGSPAATLQDADNARTTANTPPAAATTVADSDLGAKTAAEPAPKKSWRINRVKPASTTEPTEKSTSGGYKPGDGLRSVHGSVRKAVESLTRTKSDTRGAQSQDDADSEGAERSDSGSGTDRSSAPAS